VEKTNILLVDDDRDQSHVLTHFLKLHRPGLAITCAGSGEDCLRQLKDNRFAAVILDNILPDMYGTEVLNIIKDSGYDLPVVMVTGLGDEYTAVSAMKSGAYDYIVKDGNYLTRLPFALDRALERHRLLMEERRLKEQLYQSGKLAAIGQLVAGVAHEINNPMTAVIGYTQILQMQVNDPDLIKTLAKVEDAANRCRKIVYNLLSFARKHAPEKSLSQLKDALRSTIALRAYELRVNNVTVEETYAEDIPPVNMDVHQIQQVFLNLLINAEQAFVHAGRNSGRITVETYTKNIGGSRIAGVRFSDDGPGIREEDIHNIFEPFYTTNGESGGTGLGLSISRGIVAEHGGNIWAEVNGEGIGGACFVMELPIGPDCPGSTSCVRAEG